jgi:squalene synthase HpnC
LDGFAAAIEGRNSDDPTFVTGHVMRPTLLEAGVPTRHCLDLISAFKQDAVQHRYADWSELMDYCFRSAAPVGRFLLDLHGGACDGYTSSDALCNALQVINHLQDCQDDYRQLDRVYLPGAWLAASGATVADLDRPACTAPLRQVIDRCLDETAVLLHAARPLPGNLRSRRLAMESAAILNIAEALVGRLRSGDPLKRRIQLSKAGFLGCCLRGAAAALFGSLGRSLEWRGNSR